MIYPQGKIETELISCKDGICVFKSIVATDEGNILAIGHAYEKEGSSFINKTSYIENCETSAVGRALGMAGFGIDTSVASAEEVLNAIEQQDDMKRITRTNLSVLQGLIKELSEARAFYDNILETYSITDLSELNCKQYGEILLEIKRLKGE